MTPLIFISLTTERMKLPLLILLASLSSSEFNSAKAQIITVRKIADKIKHAVPKSTSPSQGNKTTPNTDTLTQQSNKPLSQQNDVTTTVYQDDTANKKEVVKDDSIPRNKETTRSVSDSKVVADSIKAFFAANASLANPAKGLFPDPNFPGDGENAVVKWRSQGGTIPDIWLKDVDVMRYRGFDVEKNGTFTSYLENRDNGDIYRYNGGKATKIAKSEKPATLWNDVKDQERRYKPYPPGYAALKSKPQIEPSQGNQQQTAPENASNGELKYTSCKLKKKPSGDLYIDN